MLQIRGLIRRCCRVVLLLLMKKKRRLVHIIFTSVLVLLSLCICPDAFPHLFVAELDVESVTYCRLRQKM